MNLFMVITDKRKFYATLFGNMLDHYDLALYNFLAPFFSSLFFPNYDKIVQLIIVYGLHIISIISRPIGSLIFGRLAIERSAQFSLFLSLMGMAISTCCIGLLPSYEKIGIFAPIILIIIKFIQGIFAAGEDSVSRLFILEGERKEKLSLISSIYQSSSMMGVVIASIVGAIISSTSEPEFYWRFGFIIASITALIGIYMRVNLMGNIKEKIEYKYLSFKELLLIIKLYLPKIINFVCLSGVSYITYSIPFIFIFNFVPEISNIERTMMYKINTYMLFLDIIILPFIGVSFRNFDSEKILRTIILIFFFSVIPVFYLFNYVNIYIILFVMIYFIFFGLIFLTHLNIWFFKNIDNKNRYLVTGLGNSIGVPLFGKTAPAICFYLWKESKLLISPAFYIMFVCLLAYVSLFFVKSNNK